VSFASRVVEKMHRTRGSSVKPRRLMAAACGDGGGRVPEPSGKLYSDRTVAEIFSSQSRLAHRRKNFLNIEFLELVLIQRPLRETAMLQNLSEEIRECLRRARNASGCLKPP